MTKFLPSVVLGALILVIGTPALAEFAPRKVDLQCMKAAVTERENKIVAAKSKAFTALNTAYTNRSAALRAAWDKTDAKERRDAINNAWSTFREAHKAARGTLRKEAGEAWADFRNDRKSCKIDTGSSASDNAGFKVDGDTM